MRHWIMCLLAVFVVQGCGQGATPSPLPATATPQPTYTLLPTYTYYPTFTPAPSCTPQPTCPACPTCTPVPLPSSTPTPERVAALVLEIVDGDTIHVSLDGQDEKVRYLAIDCPEIAHEDQPADWLGDEATLANAQLVQGQTVWLVADTPDRDTYGRLLRWVWVDDTLVNAELVRLGLAYLRDNAEGSRYAGLLHTAEAEAQQNDRGLWGATPTPTLAATSTAIPTLVPTLTPGPCLYIGNASSKIFHHANCSSVAKMSESNKVCFSTREEAIAQGYRPCQRCNP